MKEEKKISSRKKFLLDGLTALTSVLAYKSGIQKSEKKEMVKMLTADGKLVEVDKKVLDAITAKKKVSNKEIVAWKNNPSKNNNQL